MELSQDEVENLIEKVEAIRAEGFIGPEESEIFLTELMKSNYQIAEG